MSVLALVFLTFTCLILLIGIFLIITHQPEPMYVPGESIKEELAIKGKDSEELYRSIKHRGTTSNDDEHYMQTMMYSPNYLGSADNNSSSDSSSSSSDSSSSDGGGSSDGGSCC